MMTPEDDSTTTTTSAPEPSTTGNPGSNKQQRPSALVRYGPFATIMLAFAAVSGLVLVKDPIEKGAGQTVAAADRGAATLADIEDYPDGVMPLAKARADGTEDQYTWGDRCDIDAERLAMPIAPSVDCFAEFTGDNGGATTPGVTADSIKVVIYLNKSDDPLLKFIYGQIGMDTPPGAAEATYKGLNAIYSTYFETYGRKVQIIPYEASGAITDAIAAAADAETIARDIRPFAVLGGPQLTNAFGDTLAANKVLCIDCAPTTTSQWYLDRRPYVWGIQKTLDQDFQMVAEYAVKRLGGRLARFAGDPTMHDKKRVFAFVHAVTAEGSDSSSKEFLDVLSAGGVKVAEELTYSNPLTLNVEGRDIITKLKEAGVTSVILATDPVAPQALTRVATDQNYFPEWIMSGQTLVESTVFARTYDQKQWAHAFGPSNRFPYVQGGIGSPTYLYKWYFGTEPPAKSATLLMAPNLQVLYSALQGMGPNVTPENFETVLFRAPIIKGSSIAPQISFGNRGFFPLPDYMVVDDQVEIWWDSDTKGESEAGIAAKGVWQYANRGKRYLPGEWPEGEPEVGDAGSSISAPKDLPDDAVNPGDYSPIDGPRKGKKLTFNGALID